MCLFSLGIPLCTLLTEHKSDSSPGDSRHSECQRDSAHVHSPLPPSSRKHYKRSKEKWSSYWFTVHRGSLPVDNGTLDLFLPTSPAIQFNLPWLMFWWYSFWPTISGSPSWTLLSWCSQSWPWHWWRWPSPRASPVMHTQSIYCHAHYTQDWCVENEPPSEIQAARRKAWIYIPSVCSFTLNVPAMI